MDDKITKVLLDKDFKERTLLKIITNNNYRVLLTSYKVDVLLSEIWEGKNTFECDGDVSDFSKLTYLATSSIKKIKGKPITLNEIINSKFQVNIKDQKFWFQFKYRTTSVSYIFKKEFLSALGMVILF